MLHINRIVIDGFITKNQRLEFNFAKGNVTVIYGINGSGKTTLL
jgi:ABC-type cobalamin/Fe3+-siderophores transport system ATPase subunit